jgi:aspartyl-tRNA(Asn)/glutamyl-tRNA(Gln) amidotransferase subunit A
MGSIGRLGSAYRSGSLSPVAVAEQGLKRISELNPRFNCFITVLEEGALKAAAESEARYKEGAPLGPLDGVPVAVKDMIYIKGVRCTAGSKILAKNVASYDSPAAARLRGAGAVLIGTTNMHEFAAGVTSDNPHYGAVRNPWDVDRVAGGSSGGSAVAVALGLAAGALGTDTAGSVRIPAALCGVLGLKPTYGRVSRLGVIPLAPSLDTVGTLASDAWDSAAMLQVLAGHDEDDITTVDAPVPDYLAELAEPFSGAEVGVPRRFLRDLVDSSVEEVFAGFLANLRALGCRVREFDLDGLDEAYALWLPIRRAEATSFHTKWLSEHPELYGDDVRRLLELGKEVLATDYVSAINSRPSLMERFAASMADLDVVAMPATCVPAPVIGQSRVKVDGKDVDIYSALNRLTLPFNLTGFPALSIPGGQAGPLPVGVQLVARPFEEAKVLGLAHAYEAKFGAHPNPPLYK